MTMFLESPWPAIILCSMLDVVLIIIFLRTQKPVVIALLVLSSLLMAGLIALQMYIVTDREEIGQVLERLANTLEQNDPQRVMAFIAPDAPGLKSKAAVALNQVTIDEATVLHGLKVDIDRKSQPPTAKALFSGRFKGREKKTTGFDAGLAIFRFEAQLEQVNGEWLFKDCIWQPGMKQE